MWVCKFGVITYHPPKSPQNETNNQNGVIRIIVYSDYWSLK